LADTDAAADAAGLADVAGLAGATLAGALAAGAVPPQALNRIARLTIAPRAECFIGGNGTASPYFANCLVNPLATSASIGALSM